MKSWVGSAGSGYVCNLHIIRSPLSSKVHQLVRAARYAHLILFDFVTLTILGKALIMYFSPSSSYFLEDP
jgi:hypothetical protein